MAEHDNYEEPAACCMPSGPARGIERHRALHADVRTGGSPRQRHLIEQSSISSGAFVMGDSLADGRRADGESPVHPVTLEGFSIDATSVTNSDFARFVEATGYRTQAEVYGYSAVFHLAVAAPPSDIVGVPSDTPWWVAVQNADWSHPGGVLSSLEGLRDHPVVHVSFLDAEAYCRWAGRRLPTEAEWEYASRGGLTGARFPWGDDLMVEGEFGCNIWQGDFPIVNSLEDGWLTTAPVRSFAPNGYGLWQTVGNVWEWCSDWFGEGYYAESDTKAPSGPKFGTRRVVRGGSYLCHDSYCNRYRNSARSSNTPDSSMGNAGFRTVAL